MAYNTKARAGCYGLPSAEEEPSYQEIQLPLRRLTYDVELSDSLAFIQLEQIYVNNSKKTLTVQYIFPVNPQAAVHNFEVSFGGKKTKGVVKSKEEAEKQFKEHEEERRGVGFGGYYSSSARDIVKIKLGNIMPGQEIKIKMSYIHPVSVVLNTYYEFKLTTSITPRYMSSLEPRQIVFYPKFDKSMEGMCFWYSRIKIKSSRRVKSFFSKTHQINPSLNKLSQDTSQVQIIEKDMKPDKDFILAYEFEQMDKPSVLISETDNCTQAVLSFVPKFFALEQEKAKVMAIQEKEVSLPMSKIKAEYIFLLDRSGSMSGDRIKKAVESLIIFLKSLPEDSYFNVISFGHYFDKLYPESQKLNKNNIKEAIENIKVMDADHGGTEILQPLQDCLKQPVIPNYPRHIFMLTDGAIQNTSQVLSYVVSHIQYSRIHSIGIGNGASQDLILGCAKQGKGYSVMIADQEEPTSKIIQILEKSLSPLISNIQLTYDKSKVQTVIPNPEKTPYLLKNQVANFYFTFNGKLTETITIKISYTDSLGNKYFETSVINPKHAPRCSYLNKMVDFVSLNALYSMYKYGQSQEDHFFYVKQLDKAELEKKIIKESVEKQILTELTAFICVDQSLADEFLKAKLNEEKLSIKINPLNPIDHQLQGIKVMFGNQDRDDDNSSDQYQDECAIAGTYYEQPIDINNTAPLKKTNLTTTLLKRPIYLNCPNLEKKSTKKIPAIKNREKIKNLLDFVEMQEVNGMWNGDDLLAKVFNDEEIRTIIKVFQSTVPKNIYVTLAIIEQIKTFHLNNLSKVTLIMRKAQEYIQQNSTKSFEELEKIWSTYVRKINK